MMKKWFCGLLSLAVLAPATCFAETLAADNGLTITLPEGITAQAVEGDSGSSFDYQWVLSDENGDGSVSFNYQTMAVSGLEGLNFQDLTEDQLTTLKDAVAQALPDAVEQTAPAQGQAPADTATGGTTATTDGTTATDGTTTATDDTTTATDDTTTATDDTTTDDPTTTHDPTTATDDTTTTDGTTGTQPAAPAQDHLQYTLEAETGTQTHFITLVNGTMVDVYATSSEALSQEDQTLCLDLMNSVTVEGDTTTDGTTSA